MMSLRFLGFLLLLVFLQIDSDEAEPVFKAKGSVIEIGYCFGVDYVVVFRSTVAGDQLLGNFSDKDTPISAPTDLLGRVHISQRQYLLGLQINQLSHMDTGTYRRECWQNQSLVSQHTQELFVCDEEIESEEIITREQDAWTELLCNSTSIGLEGTTVRWYHEMYPTYKITLFLDTSVSMEPLVEELQGTVKVRDKGALLQLNSSIAKTNQHFYCLVMKDANCLSFKNMYSPDGSESRDIFASQGDRVVLKCPSEGYNQQWETPLGLINGSSDKNNQMTFGDKSGGFSLVIPTVSEEHSGDYLCSSSSTEVHYTLVLCPKKEFQEEVVFIGQDVLLRCDVDERDSRRVLWHHLDPSDEYKLIQDSKDDSFTLPQDLRGRLTLSENGSLLQISHLEKRDLGVYRCVVLSDLQSPEETEDIDYWQLNGDYFGEDYGRDNQQWHDAQRCNFQREIILRLFRETAVGVNFPPVTVEPVTKMNVTAAPPAASNVNAYAIGAGLACVLLVWAVILAIFLKRRHKAARSGLNTTKQNTDVDPDCTEKLTLNNTNNV